MGSASCTIGEVETVSRRYVRGTAVTGLLTPAALPALPLTFALVAALTLAACSSAPAPTPTDLTPAPAAAPQDERITLPETMGLALHHPQPQDRTERQVLYTVQQSVRSQLHAEYGSGAADPLLPTYWSGAGLTAAQRDVAAWTKRHEQPVGVLVVNSMTYSAPGADGRAAVSYCADWRNVNRGNATTHVVGAAVQQPGTAGTYTTLVLTKTAGAKTNTKTSAHAHTGSGSGGGRWKVTDLTETPNSPHCKTQTRR